MLYADRAFISINGARIADVQSATLRQNFNAKPVPTMTPDQFNTGFVKGNVDIDITMQIAVEQSLARPKIEALDFANNDVQLTFYVGSDQYVATKLFPKDTEDAASGIGEEVKTTFNFGALKLTDAIGNSVLFNLSL